MLLLALALLQAPMENPIHKELNFDPYEELNIPLDSVNLQNLDYDTCLPMRTVFPKRVLGIVIKGDGNRLVHVQECFVAGTELREKLVIVTYDDRRWNNKMTVAFVFAVRNDPLKKYEEVWGKADLGFITEGAASRTWLTLSPKPERSIQNQLKDLLLAGYETAK